MRILYALSLMLALSVGPSALAQQTNLEARYVKACMKDGDTDAFCRCEFANTRKATTRSLHGLLMFRKRLPGSQKNR